MAFHKQEHFFPSLYSFNVQYIYIYVWILFLGSLWCCLIFQAACASLGIFFGPPKPNDDPRQLWLHHGCEIPRGWWNQCGNPFCRISGVPWQAKGHGEVEFDHLLAFWRWTFFRWNFQHLQDFTLNAVKFWVCFLVSFLESYAPSH